VRHLRGDRDAARCALAEILGFRGLAGRFVGHDAPLVGAAEIAARIGVKRPQVVHDWRRRYPDFPPPVATLRQALVWNWPDVERWAKRTGRLS
jgi:predicted DNA-binding transcriptional regulator AlpA